MKDVSLRIAGCLAVMTAVYHGVVGDSILMSLDISPKEQIGFVRSGFQLGSMGWFAGGVLLFGAGGMRSQVARNWIVVVMAVMYGFPAVGAFVLTGGRPNVGGVALALVVAFAMYGRKWKQNFEEVTV